MDAEFRWTPEHNNTGNEAQKNEERQLSDDRNQLAKAAAKECIRAELIKMGPNKLCLFFSRTVRHNLGRTIGIWKEPG